MSENIKILEWAITISTLVLLVYTVIVANFLASVGWFVAFVFSVIFLTSEKTTNKKSRKRVQ